MRGADPAMIDLVVVLILIASNGFFAMSEMAVVTAKPARLRSMGRTRRGARVALEMTEHPERFLSAVQVWITLLGLLTGFFGGESLARHFAGPIATLPVLAPHAQALALGVGFSLILFASVVLGELVPKRLGTLRPEAIAAVVALPMRLLAAIAMPAVSALTVSTRLLLRLIGLGNLSGESVSEEDIRHLVAEGHEQGVLAKDEHDILNRVLRLGDRSVESLMTPRTDIVWLDVHDDVAANLHTMRSAGRSRYPVVRGSDKEVLGVLEVKRLAGNAVNENADLLRFLQPVLYVAESSTAFKLLELLRKERCELALVVDEYGDVQGLVTLTDILNAVLGRWQAHVGAATESMAALREDGSWLVDGRLPIDEFREILALADPLPDDADFHTVAGLVIDRFEHFPRLGEWLEWRGWRIEVIDLDGARIDKLLVSRIAVD
jgi:putative hemolysin